MKRGKMVAVCYDGKYERRVKGVVTGTRNGHHIKIRFTPYTSADGKEVEVWFGMKTRTRKWGGPRKYFAGWVRHGDALMPHIFPLFGVEAPGDWYSIHKWRDLPAAKG